MRKLIFGCGYLGLRVARRWQAAGDQVYAVTRSADRAQLLADEGLTPWIADVQQPLSLPALHDFEMVLYAIGYDRQAAGSMREVYVKGLQNVLAAGNQPPSRFIYISSTGVYGDASADEWIDECTPCHPSREGGRICLEAERELAGHSFAPQSIVLRLAGLYGPGRVPRAQELLAGKPISVPQTGWLNLIHVDDAVEVVLAAEQQSKVPNLYVVSDGNPVQRTEYFRVMAELLGAPPPRFEFPADDTPAANRARSAKRICNAKLLSELQITLRYPSCREGLAAILANEPFKRATSSPAK